MKKIIRKYSMIALTEENDKQIEFIQNYLKRGNNDFIVHKTTAIKWAIAFAHLKILEESK